MNRDHCFTFHVHNCILAIVALPASTFSRMSIIQCRRVSYAPSRCVAARARRRASGMLCFCTLSLGAGLETCQLSLHPCVLCIYVELWDLPRAVLSNPGFTTTRLVVAGQRWPWLPTKHDLHLYCSPQYVAHSDFAEATFTASARSHSRSETVVESLFP